MNAAADTIERPNPFYAARPRTGRFGRASYGLMTTLHRLGEGHVPTLSRVAATALLLVWVVLTAAVVAITALGSNATDTLYVWPGAIAALALVLFYKDRLSLTRTAATLGVCGAFVALVLMGRNNAAAMDAAAHRVQWVTTLLVAGVSVVVLARHCENRFRGDQVRMRVAWGAELAALVLTPAGVVALFNPMVALMPLALAATFVAVTQGRAMLAGKVRVPAPQAVASTAPGHATPSIPYVTSTTSMAPARREVVQPPELAGAQQVAAQPAVAPAFEPAEPAVDIFRHLRNLTAQAAAGDLEPVVGRDKEIDQAARVLSQREAASVALVGEPGVGKTAIVRGLAQRIVEGNVPPRLKDTEVWELVSLAGQPPAQAALVLEAVTEFISEEGAQRVLAWDELHTVMTTGGPGGHADALKPALADGTVRVIGATTHEEMQLVTKDRAMARRFTPVSVPEPDEDAAAAMLSSVAVALEQDHGVRLDTQAVAAAVSMSKRYLPGALPAKAKKLLDQASVLASTRGIDAVVTKRDIAQATENSTGIPVTELADEDRERVSSTADRLRAQVTGQDEAVELVSRAILREHAGLADEKQPNGVFLLLGPSGVGKTELARAVARDKLGTTEAFLKLDMSEYADKHNAARLIGPPPAYVGYEEGGQLTNFVLAHPYSVVLLDEIEKADPSVLTLMLQLFEDGVLTDGQGRTVDFSNTFVFMTSNVGSRGGASTADTLIDAAHAHFAPEFLGRIHALVPFSPLTPAAVRAIAEPEVAKVATRLAARGLELVVEDRVYDVLMQTGYDPELGARPLKSAIARLLTDPLAAELLKSDARTASLVEVSVVEGTSDLAFAFSAPVHAAA